MIALDAAAIATLPTVSPADSARAAATVYSVSLLATAPVVVAILAAWMLRRAGAEGRMLVWRSAVVTLLSLFVGRQLPLHWMAWVVPPTLSAPLIELGRVQVAPRSDRGSPIVLVKVLLALYGAGVLSVLVSLAVGRMQMRSIVRRGIRVGAPWRRLLEELRAERGVRRAVHLVASRDAAVPMTWGVLRPVIVVPERALSWTDEQRRMVLLHELEHVRSGDAAFGFGARLVCALYWFHPGAWWIARELRASCELACDERVIAAGTRRSDYAELLVNAADRLLPAGGALALSARRGLRARLAAVLDARREVRPLARGWFAVATAATITIAAPMSAVQLAPTRDVLTQLMSDSRWESRAYAVLGLARRADSVAVARTAAERDPSPRVRAWARYALGDQAVPGNPADLGAILHTR